MRLYAFLLLAACALAARAHTIPQAVLPLEEKKIDVVPEDKTPENVASEQELIDQANTINDVDNKLRVKPADIPVEVVVENVEQALKASNEAEEVVRAPVDLRNPGPPQRQEHETQNPEFYAAEQQIVLNYKQNIKDAELTLRQGFQGVSDGIQNLFQNNEQVKLIQENINNLREGFIAQINKLNGTIQAYLSADNANVVSPIQEQTKANLQNLETGLTALKNDFTRNVNTLAEGVGIFASLRADGENSATTDPAAGSTPAPAAPGNIFTNFVSQIENSLNGLRNMTNNLSMFVQNGWQGQQAGTAAQGAAQPGGTQSDTQAPAAPSQPTNSWFPIQIPSSISNILNIQNDQSATPPQPGPLQNLIHAIQNAFQPNRVPQGATTQSAPPATTKNPSVEAPTEKPASENEPKPEAQANQASIGPIRQILQNNPISQGIAGAVQRLQNINNPEKPREPETQKAVETVDEQPKGHTPATGDNNNSDIRVEENAPVKEVQQESLPVVQEPTKEETEQKAQEVVDKTE